MQSAGFFIENFIKSRNAYKKSKVTKYNDRQEMDAAL